MKSRRNFIKTTSLGSIGTLALNACHEASHSAVDTTSKKQRKPIVISTWNHGMAANQRSWQILQANGTALDAVEQGVKVVESDPDQMSVGLGGLPDRDGHVTLDACIMNHENQCGSVAFLENIENPISVARKVMESTPHVMLAGEGAYDFAIKNGFPHKDLLTTRAHKRWQSWLQESKYDPIINIENHDTIGSLALDVFGNLSGACTTSGLAWKMRGRVGDSPIIGAGLFVDNEAGAACATGVGEAVIRIAGSAIVVELMRTGASPQQACEEAVKRIIKKHKNINNMQVGFLALNPQGEFGTHSIHPGFNFALTHEGKHELIDASYQQTN